MLTYLRNLSKTFSIFIEYFNVSLLPLSIFRKPGTLQSRSPADSGTYSFALIEAITV